MDLKNLSDVHTGRNAKGVEHDIERSSVGKERHIFNGKNAGNDTLVSVTTCHLITDGDLSLLSDIYSYAHIYAGRKFIGIVLGKYLGIDNCSVLTVRNLKGSIPYFSGLLTEDRTQQSLLCGKLGLSLGSNTSDKDVTCSYLCTDADDSVLIKIFESFLTYTVNVTGDLLGSELGVTCFCLVLFDVDRGVNIFTYETLGNKNSVLVVVSFPGHESDKRVLTESELSVIGGRTVSDNLALYYLLALLNDGSLVVAVTLVGTCELAYFVFHVGAVIILDLDGGCINIGNGSVLFCDYAYTRVNGCLYFHAGSYCGSIGGHKRHCLSLHVRSHESTVSVVVLKERNECGSNREDHLRRNVHVVETCLGILLGLISVTTGNVLLNKVTFLVKLLVSLGNIVVVLFVCSHVNNGIGNLGILGIALVYFSVGSFYESVLIDASIACK